MGRLGGNDVRELLLQVDASVELARSKLAILTRDVDINSKKMDADLARVDGATGRLGGAFSKLSASSGALLAGFGAAGVASVGRQVLQFGDDLEAAAEKAGIGIERYQTLKAALRELEVEGDKVDKIFQIMQATIGDVQSGVETGATKALDKLGVSAKILSGEITTADQGLDAIAASSGKAGTQAQFAALLVDIFSKKLGMELVPALSNGGAALQGAEQHVRDFGAVLSVDMAKNLADANEDIDFFWQSAVAITAINAGTMIKLIKEVIAWYQQIPTASPWLQFAGTMVSPAASLAVSGFGSLFGQRTSKETGARVSQLKRRLAAATLDPDKAQIRVDLQAAQREHQSMLARERGGAAGGAVGNLVGNLISGNVSPSTRITPRARGGGGGGRSRGGGGRSRGRPAKPELTGDEQRESWLFAQEKDHEFDLNFQQAIGDGIELQGKLADLDQLLLKIGTDDMPNLGDMLPEEQEQRIRDFQRDFEHDLASGLADAIVNGENLGDVLVNSLKRAAAAIIESGIIEMLNMIGGQGQGSNGGGLFRSLLNVGSAALGSKPARAAGGQVFPGQAYQVGERGTELFVPKQAGTIMPNSALGGKGGGGGEAHIRISLDNDMLDARVVSTSGHVVAAAIPQIEAGAASKAINILLQHRLPGLG